MNVRFIDTSIMTNLLNIPNKNEQHTEIKLEFEESVKAGDDLILPISTIIETGNHIAHVDDGRLRRKIAERFSEYLRKTADKNPPWTLYGIDITKHDLIDLANDFPEKAMIKMGIGDLSIIHFYKKNKDEIPSIGRIMIWSTDSHLSGYKEDLTGVKRRSRRR